MKDKTLNVRLSGIDAPELAHFGGTEQPFALEAKLWLTNEILNKRVRIVMHFKDHFGRAICSVYYKKYWFIECNLSLEMVKAGYATVYRESNACYGGIYDELVLAEQRARSRRVGMWQQRKFVSPAEHKRLQKSKSENK